MEIAAIIFFVCLLVPGIMLIVFVGRDMKRKAAVRAEQERYSPAQTRQPRLTPRQGLAQVRAAARKQADPWKNVTPSVVSEAFKKFYRDDPAYYFDCSLVSAVFEKFTEEMRIKR